MTIIKHQSMKKVGKKSKRGGKRDNAGRPSTGITKVKKSVSLDKGLVSRSLEKWEGQTLSGLLEKLLRDYAD